MQLSEVDLLDPDTYRLGRHHEMFQVVRAEDPVHWTEEPHGGGFWSITRHADLITVNRDAHVFSSAEHGISIPDIPEDGAMVREMMLYMDPPRHTRYRLLVNKGFTPRMIGLLEAHLTAKAAAIVDNVESDGRCDFVTDIASELPLQAIAELMGVPQEDRRKLFDWSNRMIGADDPEFQKNAENAAEAQDAASEWLYMNSSVAALPASSMPSASFWNSGSSAPIMRFDHSKSLWRSSCGTPISSAMACSGSSAAMSETKSHDPSS